MVRLSLRSIAVGTGAASLIVACVISTTTRPVSLPKVGGRVVTTPLKVHLVDGSLVIFPSGATISATEVSGTGDRFEVTRSRGTPTARVPLDSVLGFETYERQVNPGRTLVYGTLTLAASLAGAAGLAIAVFGSCPTIYADSAGQQVLQAESFSNSIAPLLARRDLDRLIVAADSAGIVRLDVRNEALETHYIDHLDLVEFRHRPGEMVMPASPSGVIAVSDLIEPASVRDAAERDVRLTVAASDEVAFSTDSTFLDRAINGGPVEEHLDITVPRAAAGDTFALVLRVRASLLSTSVLYHYMLGQPGASALDWLGRDLARITTLARLSGWYAENFGLHLSVLEGGKWKRVARMVNFGPAAWRSIGVVVPSVGRDSVRLRLSFLADEYRVDHIAVARRARQLERRTIAISRIIDSNGKTRDDIAKVLRRADSRNLQTYPGDRFYAEFDVGRGGAGTRTFMVGSEGYYTEWVRGSWLRATKDTMPFDAERVTSRDILQRWRASKDTLEQRFFTRKVPVA